jgi:hypothetical protein
MPISDWTGKKAATSDCRDNREPHKTVIVGSVRAADAEGSTVPDDHFFCLGSMFKQIPDPIEGQ